MILSIFPSSKPPSAAALAFMEKATDGESLGVGRHREPPRVRTGSRWLLQRSVLGGPQKGSSKDTSQTECPKATSQAEKFTVHLKFTSQSQPGPEWQSSSVGR